jgi:hypothetical protein
VKGGLVFARIAPPMSMTTTMMKNWIGIAIFGSFPLTNSRKGKEVSLAVIVIPPDTMLAAP